MRVHSPAIPHPCFLGVDLARRDELIAHHLDVPGICRAIGADSLGFLSLAGLLQAAGGPRTAFCAGCLTGDYPVPVQVEISADMKLALEANRRAPTLTAESPLPVHDEDRLEPLPVGSR
jgi:amidophosphoribosyltransferase